MESDLAEALRDISDRLARVALGCPLGAQAEPRALEEEGSLLRAISFCEELQHQSQELHAIGTAYNNKTEEDISLDALHKKILKLHKTVENSSEFASNRELLIKTCLINKALVQILMEDRSEKSEAILAQLFHKTTLSQQIIAVTEKKIRVREQLLDNQREVLAMKQQNQALLKEVKEARGVQESQNQKWKTAQPTAGRDKLAIANNRVTILRNVLQALVQSSGTNWAADSDLQSFVLQMGKDKKF